jgi:hypothetical protein
MKKAASFFLSGVFLLWMFSPPAAFPQNYIARAWSFIRQANAEGPPAGLNKLIGGNANKDARGCAVKVAKTDPLSAANIMIAVGENLMRFARITRQTRAYQNPKDPVQPFRYQYWQEAVTQLNLASRYISQVAKTNPPQAAQLAIKLATLFYNNIPANASYETMRNTYRQRAATYLHASNSESARYYAGKIRDRNRRQIVLKRIQALRKSWNL